MNDPALDAISAYLDRFRSKDIPITWISPRIEPHVSPNRLLRSGCTRPQTLRPGQAEAFVRLDAAIASRAAAHGLGHLPLAALDFDMARDFVTCDTLFWSDGDHWSTAGEARFGARLMPHLPEVFR